MSHKYIYYHFFCGGFGLEFIFVSTSVCDSRNWNSRSNTFVRTPSTGRRPQRPSPCRIRSARGRGKTLSERSEKCTYLCILGGIRPSYSWILAYVELERINKGQHFQIEVISKLASKFLPDHSLSMASSKRTLYRGYYCCVSFPFGSVGIVLYQV